jgi:hypothetical protein
MGRNQFSDKNIKSIFGIGFMGDGIYSTNNFSYQIWRHIIRRCYSKEQKFKTWHDCLVDERWHNFQNFAEWYEKNYIDGYHLDKDILIKGNKIYGPDTCCFVPNQINTLFRSSKENRTMSKGVQLDKRRNTYNAILQKSGKRYFLGTFKTHEEAFNLHKIEREKYIKEIANKWKDEISDKVYQALMNYNVEISD